MSNLRLFELADESAMSELDAVLKSRLNASNDAEIKLYTARCNTAPLIIVFNWCKSDNSYHITIKTGVYKINREFEIIDAYLFFNQYLHRYWSNSYSYCTINDYITDVVDYLNLA